MKKLLLIFLLIPFVTKAQYKGSASVTQGKAATIITNLYSCTGGRIAGIGTITASDKTVWTVPALTNFNNSNFPFASDLNNPCNGANYTNSSIALSKLNGSDIITVDNDGELITAYVFADNYFEMYINGKPVGKDNVPFTQFNSNIIRFKVKKPFTIAMMLVDWEENLGLGSENNGGFAYHPGDGGLVAVFKDINNNTIAKTDNSWKAQTYYTSPIIDLSCPSEIGNIRLTDKCSTQNSNDGSKYYALHWALPDNWMNNDFDETAMPSSSTFTNAEIGVDNKPAYTNFINIFDEVGSDAQFIWSSNIILDNLVIVRYKVAGFTEVEDTENINNEINISPNPSDNKYFKIDYKINIDDFVSLKIYNTLGIKVLESDKLINEININNLQEGIYILNLQLKNKQINTNLIIK